MGEILSPSEARLKCIQMVARGEVILSNNQTSPWLSNLSRRAANGENITTESLRKEDGQYSTAHLDPWAARRFIVFPSKDPNKTT